MEKSHDGWWRGQKEGVVGDFPASFVEEIEIPRTKEEAKRLAQRFGKKSPDKMQQMSDGRPLNTHTHTCVHIHVLVHTCMHYLHMSINV